MYLASQSSFQIVNVGIIWIVYAITHSALDIAIIGIANTLSTVIVTLPAGVWVDRVNRFQLLLISTTVSVSCIAVLAFLSLGYNFVFVIAVGIVIVWAAALELYRSTSLSVLPDIVETEKLPGANGITQSSYQIVSSISVVLGGVLIVISGATSNFVYGMIGYGLAALFSARLVHAFRNQAFPEQTEKRNMEKEIVEGIRWLLTERGLLGLSLMALVFNFLFAIPVYFIVIYVTSLLNAGAFLYGAILAIFAAGTAGGSLLAGKIPKAVAYAGKVNILLIGGVAGSILILLGFVPNTLIALIGVLGVGLGVGFANTVWLNAAQNIVPPSMRGRFFAIDGLLSFVGGPPAIAVGGILITLVGIAEVFEIAGAFLLASSLVFAFVKSLWSLDGRPRTFTA
jgi:MFS family permease